MANEPMLRVIRGAELPQLRRQAVDAETLRTAASIVDDVRLRGEAALRAHAERLGDIPTGAELVIERPALDAARDRLPRADREMLERVAGRIRRFAEAQAASLRLFDIDVPGGRAGQLIAPVERAGCYAPGGRFPLPSSVLMTAVTARAAGVPTVIVASPKPAATTLAAASIAGADLVLAAGGAQAIAAMAYGAGLVSACDVIAGPGNRYVTAAKKLVAGDVGIDMLAGPSELTVVADASADAAVVAMDLLAQAEHDPDAVPILVTLDRAFVDAVNTEIAKALAELPTRATAGAALKNGCAVVVDSLGEAVAVCDRLASEHLSLHLKDADAVAPRFSHYGALFIGDVAAEAIGDYGAGPNHTLPTSGTSRHTGGLSVFNFLRVRTWLRIDDAAKAEGMLEDAVQLGEIEGLAAHARSVGMRISSGGPR